MNFGMGKMRPCGHLHHYKYAHAITASDLARVNRNWSLDYNLNKELTFIYTNFKNANQGNYNSMSGAWNGVEKIDNNFPVLSGRQSHCLDAAGWTLKYLNLYCPDITVAHAFIFANGSSRQNMKEIYINFPSCIDVSTAFNFIGNNEVAKFNLPECLYINDGSFGSVKNDDRHVFELYAPKVKDASSAFGANTKELKYSIDEDGNFSFSSGKPAVDYRFLTFPYLEKGENMFRTSDLSYDYLCAFVEDLPDYSNSETTHKLGLGFHIDKKYDPKLQTELLKVGNNYTPTVNISGGPFTNKNWDLTVYWNGTSNGYAHRPPMNEIEFSDNTIPENYTRCDYLESSGNQYIKTGYIPNNTSGVYVDVLMLSNGITLGCNNHWAHWQGPSIFGLGINNSAPSIRWMGSTDFSNPDKIQTINKRFGCRMNYKNDRFLFYDFGENKWLKENLETLKDTNVQYDIYFFAFNSAGTISKASEKIYRFQITEGEELIRDYVPCLDTEGTPCFYELINGETLYNAGTGQFTYEIEEI